MMVICADSERSEKTERRESQYQFKEYGDTEGGKKPKLEDERRGRIGKWREKSGKREKGIEEAKRGRGDRDGPHNK